MTEVRARKRALVVDDDVGAATVLTAFARRLGIETETAYDVPSATGLIDSRSWDLLVTDLQLAPGEAAGTDLIRRVRERSPAARTILVSGSTMQDVVLPAAAVADRFLPKPVSFAAFGAAVRELLGLL